MKPKKQYSQLSYEERQTISIAQEQGLSIRAMARMLKRSPSTISREITRNGGGGSYSCRFTQQRHVRTRGHSLPPPKLVVSNVLFESVQTLLHLRWSPQQIAGHLARACHQSFPPCT